MLSVFNFSGVELLDFGKNRELRHVTYSRRAQHPASQQRLARNNPQKKILPTSFGWVRKLVAVFGLVAFVLVGGAIGYLAFKSYTAITEITVANKRSGEVSASDSTYSDRLPILDWEKKRNRINILLLGLDKRKEEKAEFTRTDTVILASINPEDYSVLMISLPRDLEVPYTNESGRIQYIRVNAVHVYGKKDGDKGAGPAAVKEVVSDILGLPVHYFLRLDFEGFERVVDELGGITLDVQYPLYDYEYPTANYGYQTVKIDPGLQVMNGEVALQYTRSRKAVDPRQAGDLNRARRQQEVVIAVKEKAIAAKSDLITDPVKLARFLDTLKDNVLTDIRLEEMLALAELMRNIDTNNPRKMAVKVLEPPLIYSNNTAAAGWRFYARDKSYDEIREWVKQQLLNPYLQQDIADEDAVVRVENGSSTSGIANDVTYLLRTKYNLSMQKAVTAQSTDFAKTVIYDISNGAKSKTLGFLEEYFDVQASVPIEYDPAELADIVLILGDDYQPVEDAL